MTSAIAYYRVATARQGKSGLAIEAQKAAIARFAEAEGIAVIGDHTEVETGKGADALDRRPELAAALAKARKSKCPACVMEGHLMILRDEVVQGVEVLREAFETCRRTGWRQFFPPFFAGPLAEGLAGLGRSDEALDVVNDAIAKVGQGIEGLPWCLPELFRLKGEFLLAQSNGKHAAAIDDCFHSALRLAREQGALLFELRTAISLARLRVAQSRHGEAREILAPVYGRFAEGFNTADLLAAKQLLDGLAAAGAA